jgi:hypothetical protein
MEHGKHVASKAPLSGRKIVFETAKDYHLADAMWLILCMFPARLFLTSMALHYRNPKALFPTLIRSFGHIAKLSLKDQI